MDPGNEVARLFEQPELSILGVVMDSFFIVFGVGMVLFGFV
jgi:hypothetical protein